MVWIQVMLLFSVSCDSRYNDESNFAKALVHRKTMWTNEAGKR